MRLLKAPAAMIVVVALLVLPSLYTWYNVVAFWNPYEATGNLKVCVVNQDAGANNELAGEIDVGKLVTDELLANDKLDFSSKELDEAIADLEAGRFYAVYVIPQNFSECLLSPLTGEIQTPTIEYYVNEKLGPVSPKITDTAANTLEQTINSSFVETVSEVAVQAIDDAVNDAEAGISEAETKVSSGMAKATSTVAEVRSKLGELQVAIVDAKSKVTSTSSKLDDAYTLTTDAKTLLSDISVEASVVQDALARASSDAVSSLSIVVTQVSQVTTKASLAADVFLADAGTAESRVELVAARVEPFINTLHEVSDDMQQAASRLPDSSPLKQKILDASQKLEDKAVELQSAVDEVTALSERVTNVAQQVSDSAESLSEAVKQLSDNLQTYSDDLFGSAAPAITSSLAKVSATCTRLSSTVSDLETTIGEAQAGLRQLEGLLDTCSEAVSSTDSLINSMQDDIVSIRSDLRLLAQSDTIVELVEGGSLNPQNISAFMGSPTKLETVQLYHPNAYGTAMAPLFMNLTFWIGAFMLVIIFRLEVDDEGIKRLTLWQRYVSRLLLFAGLAIMQAIICCAGVLALGVQVSNVPALFLGAAMSSLAYMGIIYALSSTLRHIGKALCIILVFAQIPGGSGLYPLELTDRFFQTIYPFLPFSYGIDVLREAIGGFYGNFFARDIAVLVAIFIVMLILGIALGPVMSNVTRMAARQISEGDLYNGEDALVPERPYRLSQMVQALSDRDDFRENLESRYERFSKLYPVFIHISIVLTVGVPVLLMVLLALDAGEKVVLLSIVLLWLVGSLVAVSYVESHRYSLERQLNLEHMSGDNVMNVLFQRESMVSAVESVSRRANRLAKDSSKNEQSASETKDPPVSDDNSQTGEADDA